MIGEQIEARYCLSTIGFAVHDIDYSETDGPFSVSLADLDGDGDVDLLCASVHDDTIAWFENTDGLGRFGRQQVISTNVDGANEAKAADLDGDGDLDVLTTSASDGGAFAWYENTDGLGSFGAWQIVAAGDAGTSTIFPGDVDGDGDLDVLCESRDDTITWYENIDGRGSFGERQLVKAYTFGTRGVHAGDVDGDGDLDVLYSMVFSERHDRIVWHENTDGRGTFGDLHLIARGALNAGRLSAGDIDGDGDLDVLSASVIGI
jgi:hypothetical protein